MDSYLKAWQALPRFRGTARLDTWLYRIVYNVALDRIRKQQRRHELPLAIDSDEDRPHEIPDPTAAAPDALLQRHELQAEVRAALQQLPASHRTALELRYVEELSYAEIAAATGVSMGTVMSRIFNAKRKLKKEMVSTP